MKVTEPWGFVKNVVFFFTELRIRHTVELGFKRNFGHPFFGS